MSLATPERIRSLQRKLYCTAKAKPAFRFYTLYDKICRVDILAHAYEVARSNAGAPGVDGRTFEHIEASGLQEWTSAVGRTVTPVGKPDAGNQHVRFDERGRETEQALQGSATAPVLDSTKTRVVTPLPLATVTLPFGFGGQGNLDQAANCLGAGGPVLLPLGAHFNSGSNC